MREINDAELARVAGGGTEDSLKLELLWKNFEKQNCRSCSNKGSYECKAATEGYLKMFRDMIAMDYVPGKFPTCLYKK